MGSVDQQAAFTVVKGRDFYLPMGRFLKELPKDYIGTLADIQTRYGPLVHWRLMGGAMNFAFISDAAINRELFVQQAGALTKSASQVQTFLYAAGPSVATAHGEDWKTKRREANSLFSRKIVEASCAGQVEVVRGFAQSLQGVQDGVDMARRLAAITSSRGILGREISMAEAEVQIAFSKAAGERFNAESAHLFARPNWMLAPWRRKLARCKAQAFAIVGRAIEEMRGSEAANDGLMVHYVNGDFVTSSDAEMRSILVGLLMGAQDNIASAAAWVLAFVARDVALQDQIREEIAHVGTAAQDLRSCALLQASIAEVLRIRPPAPANQPRVLSESVEIAGHVLPKGTYVFNSVYNMHHDGAVFPEPESFQPSRFLEPALARSASFVPFGHGARNCVAQGMAMQQLSAILFGLLRDRRIVAQSEDLPETLQLPFLTPASFDVAIEPLN